MSTSIKDFDNSCRSARFGQMGLVGHSRRRRGLLQLAAARNDELRSGCMKRLLLPEAVETKPVRRTLGAFVAPYPIQNQKNSSAT